MTSPTGRDPRLVWTPTQQAVWAQMRADYAANPADPATLGGRYYKLITTKAANDNLYGDTGLWRTLMYQITGDPLYAARAWDKIAGRLLTMSGTPLGGNFAREYAAEYVLQYDWLYPAMTDDQRAQYRAKLDELFTVSIVVPRMNDSDQTTGVYFGVAWYYVATADHHPPAAGFWQLPIVGGFTATGPNRDTMRNAIADYVSMSAGGEWVEGSDYSLGTVRLLLLGVKGVMTATGLDHFPEVTTWIQEAARRPLHVSTPDRRQSYQWGDTQHPRGFVGLLYTWQTTHTILSSLSGDPHLQWLTQALEAAYPDEQPWPRAFLACDPYAPTAGPEALPRGWVAPGQGVLTCRTGWADEDALFMAHVPTQQSYVDHQVLYQSDFQLYRAGEWSLTHPLGYGGPPLRGEGTNSVIHAGLSANAFAEVRGTAALEADPAGTYAYLVGTTGGQFYSENYYNPPPTFLHEWTRHVLWLPRADRAADTVVVFDRSHLWDPQTLPNYHKYRATDRAQIEAGRPLRESILHMPTPPALTADGFGWSLPSGDVVAVRILSPTPYAVDVLDESVLWAATNSVSPAEKKWQARVAPVGEHQAWQTGLYVVSVSAPGLSVSAQHIADVSFGVEGVLLHTEGEADTLVIFNALPGPVVPLAPNGLGYFDPVVTASIRRARLRVSGYTVAWTTTAAETRVFLTDLDPQQVWTVRVNDGPILPLPLSVQGGLAQITVPSAGPHIVTVSGG